MLKWHIEKYGTSRHFTHTGGTGAGSGFLLCIHMVTSSYNYTGNSLHHIHIFEGIIKFLGALQSLVFLNLENIVSYSFFL